MLLAEHDQLPERVVQKRHGDGEDDLHHAVEQVTTDENGMVFITQTIHFYPIFRPVKWISYYSGPSGSGATFIADSFYYDGIGPTSLPGSEARQPDLVRLWPAPARERLM